MPITTPTAAGTPARLQQDTEALLRMICNGGTMAGLFKLSDEELDALYTFGLGHYTQGRWTGGPTVEFHLTHGFSLEFDALYRNSRTTWFPLPK